MRIQKITRMNSFKSIFFKRHLLYSVILTVCVAVTTASCSRFDDATGTTIEYIPFQEEDNGLWGMISPNGEVLFANEFKLPPTPATDGMFFVQNENGYWELYKAKSKPEKVRNTEYTSVSRFSQGKAVVAKNGGGLCIINVDGKIEANLDEIDGKSVVYALPLKKGYSVYMNDRQQFGVVDQNGKSILPSKYLEIRDDGFGKFLVIDNKYENDYKNASDRVHCTIIDANKNTLYDFVRGKYERIGDFYNGKLAVSVKKNGQELWGILNEKGEHLISPSSKILDIGKIRGDYFTYFNGDSWGLMNMQGEQVIRAKYSELIIDDDNTLIANIKSNPNDDSNEYKYIDTNDSPLSDDTYIEAKPFSLIGGSYALVKSSDKTWSLIDRQGNTVEGLPDISNVAVSVDEEKVMGGSISDFVNDLHISNDGVFGLTSNSTPEEVDDTIISETASSDGDGGYDVNNNDDRKSLYTQSTDMGFWCHSLKRKYDTGVLITIEFYDNVSKQTYTTKKVIDYQFGYYTYYHNEQVPNGYEWVDIHPCGYSINISNDGITQGKLRILLNALIDKFRTFPNAYIYDRNSGAAIISYQGGDNIKMVAKIYMTENSVNVNVEDYGNGDPYGNRFLIDEYSNVKENITHYGQSSLLN